MLYVPKASREELEAAILENQIIPAEEIATSSTEQLRDYLTAWIMADDECSDC